MPDRVLSRVGRCIYCARPDRLTKEHIIPFGLSGTDVLLDASCQDCAKETGRLEARLLRKIYLPIRIHHNLRTRRPKERPTKLVMKGTHVVSGQARVIELPAKKFPHSSIGLVLPPPEIFRPPGESPMAKVWYRAIIEKSVGDAFGPDWKFDVVSHAEIAAIARFYAKIAHGYAVAEWEWATSGQL